MRTLVWSIGLVLCTTMGAPLVYGGLLFGPPETSDSAELSAGNLLSRGIEKFRDAKMLFREGRHDECADLLTNLRKQDPSLPPIETILVWFLMADGKLADAKPMLEQVAIRYPNHPHTSLTLGQIALAEHRLAEAAVLMEKAATVALPPEWDTPQQRRFAILTLDTLATVYEQQRRWSIAKQTLAAVLNLELNDRRRFRLARALYHCDETRLAIDQINELRQSSPGLPPTPLLFAQFAVQAKDHSRVETHLAEANREFPEHDVTQLWTAEWALTQDDPERASECLKAIGTTPGNAADVARVRGLLAARMLDFDLAIKNFEDALRKLSIPEARCSVQRQSIMVHAWQGVHEDDPELLGRTLKMAETLALEHSTDGDTVSLLGWIYHLHDRREEAEQLLSRGIQLVHEPSPDQAFYLADFLASSPETSDHDRARAIFDELAQSRGKYLLFRPWLASRLERMSPKQQVE